MPQAQAQVRQPVNEEDIFDSLRKSVASLRDNKANAKFSSRERKEVKELLDSIDSSANYIYEVARKRPQARMPQEYYHSLLLDANLLKGIADRWPNVHPIEAVLRKLEVVASDLDIKVTYIRSSRSAALRLVQVVVHTMKDSQEIGGYEVWYVPKGWADEKGAFRRFGRLSSPTYTDLAPGNYLMWVRRGQTETRWQTFSIGKNGKSREEIDFEVQ